MIKGRIAAVLTWLYAACFGIPAIPVAVYLRQRGTLPWFEDFFPMYGGPWWSRFGVDGFVDAFTITLLVFLGLTLAAAWTAWLMWKGSKRGAAANVALLSIEAVFWLGFCLPIPWILGIARAAFVAAAWNGLNRSLRTAALLTWLLGLGFGLPCVYGIWYFADQGLVWTFMGLPTYGEGPFEDIGLVTTVPLLVAFLLVCLAELVMGWLLWRRRRSGVVLSLVLLPLEFAFWIGFLLPFGFMFGAARTVLVLTASTSTNHTEAVPSRRVDRVTAGPEAIVE